MPKLGVLIMVKNEEKRILFSLKSVLGIADEIYIYDTGSTDNTESVIREFCKENNLPLFFKKGEFIDFSTSRNVSLDMVDENLSRDDYVLLLDSNDELRGGDKLREFINLNNREDRAYIVRQIWWSGSFTEYYNVRLLRGKSGFRYKGVVHEYICDTINITENDWIRNPCRLPADISIYQDRVADENKSFARFFRDKELLEREYEKNPDEPRTCFYLAQTYSCVGDNEKAYEFYSKRTKLRGFFEERFHAFLRAGELSEVLKKDWSISVGFYLGAYEIIERAEPLVKIASYYREKEKWKLAYSFISLACEYEYPKMATLFVDPKIYSYTRYHLMGIIAFYSGNYEEGEKAVRKALEYNPSSEIDLSNLSFYTKIKEKEVPLTKKQFLLQEEEKIRLDNPKLNPKKIKSLALAKYKARFRKNL